MLYVAAFLKLLCYAVIVLIFVRAAFSWFSQNQRNPVYRYSYLLTEPLLAPVRSVGDSWSSGSISNKLQGPVQAYPRRIAKSISCSNSLRPRVHKLNAIAGVPRIEASIAAATVPE